MSRRLHSTFNEISIHTAKCDRCSRHNTDIIYRCCSCGLQICTPCKDSDIDDGTHVLNGGTRSMIGTPRTSTPVPAPAPSTLMKRTAQPQRRRATTIPTAVTDPVSTTVSSSTRTAPLRRTQSSRKRKSRTIVESDSEECSSETPEAFRTSTHTLRESKRLQVSPFESSSSGNFESFQSSTTSSAKTSPSDVDHLQASLDVRSRADYLLALATPLSTPTEPASAGSSNDQHGMMLLVQAAAMAEEQISVQSECQEVEDDEQDAQPQSPLFFPEEPDLTEETLATEILTGIDAPATKRRAVSEVPADFSAEKDRAMSEAPIKREMKLPIELMEVCHSVNEPGNERLGESFRKVMLVSRRREPLF